MLTKHWCLVVVCSVAALVSGCGAYAWEPLRVGATHAAVGRRSSVVPQRMVVGPTADAIAHVLLLEGNADRPSEVVGLIDEHGQMGHEAEALERLRAHAARMGADAVVHIEFEHAGEHSHGDDDVDGDVDESASSDFSGEHEADLDSATDEGAAEQGSDPLALHLSGTAVRFRDLIGGRPYEVIGRIEVSAGMTHEDQALAQLRRRARAVHADLIIGIAFHHGNGEGGIGVEGTAIRFTR